MGEQEVVGTPRARRGVWAVGLLGVGLVAGRELAGVSALWWLSGAVVVCALAVLVVYGAKAPTRRGAVGRWHGGRVGVWMLGAAVVLLGAGWFGVRVVQQPAAALAVMLSGAEADSPLAVRGVMLEDARQERAQNVGRGPRGGGTVERFELGVRGARLGSVWVKASGVLRVSVWEGTVTQRAGEAVEMVGRWRGNASAVNPGQRDGALWDAQDGMAGSLAVENAGAIRAGEFGGAWDRVMSGVRRAWAGLRGHAAEALSDALDGENDQGDQTKALLRAMLIGRVDPELRPVSDALARLGIVHLLSISGFHLVLGALLVVWLVRLTGDRGAWEPLIAAVGVVGYVLIAPAEAPIVRSALMILALLVSEACGRRYDRLNVLGWSACVVLLWRPMDLWSAGFQLSFGVTGALLWRGRAWQAAVLGSRWFGMPGVKGRVRPQRGGVTQMGKEWAAGAISTGALAWVVSVPVVIWHTGMVSLLGMAGGLVLTVPATLALMAGFLALLTGAAGAGSVAGVCGVVSEWLASVVVVGSDWVSGLPGVYARLPQMPVAWAVGATAVVVACSAPGGWRRWGVRAALGGVAVWAGVVMWQASHLSPFLTGRVERFALPSSGVMLVRSGDEAVLVDPGSARVGSGARTIQRAVTGCGVWHVRSVVVTSPEATALNHVVELVEPLGVRVVYVASLVRRVAEGKPDSPTAVLLRGLTERGVEVREMGERVDVGAAGMWIDRNGFVWLGSQTALAGPIGPVERAERMEVGSNGVEAVLVWLGEWVEK